LAKKARVYDGTAWQELASAQTDLTAYSTTAQVSSTYSPISTTGLVLITSQTIGTAVSSVTVSNAFSATYDAYKIVVSGGVGSGDDDMYLKLGSSTTGYYSVRFGYRTTNVAAGFVDSNNGARFLGGSITTNFINMNCELINPFLSKYTLFNGNFIYNSGAGLYCTTTGDHRVATSFTDFTITPNSGTMTGGTIRVYGYKN